VRSYLLTLIAGIIAFAFLATRAEAGGKRKYYRGWNGGMGIITPVGMAVAIVITGPILDAPTTIRLVITDPFITDRRPHPSCSSDLLIRDRSTFNKTRES